MMSHSYPSAVQAWHAKSGASMEHPFYYDTCWDLWRTVDFLQKQEAIDPQRLGMVEPVGVLQRKGQVRTHVGDEDVALSLGDLRREIREAVEDRRCHGHLDARDAVMKRRQVPLWDRARHGVHPGANARQERAGAPEGVVCDPRDGSLALGEADQERTADSKLLVAR